MTAAVPSPSQRMPARVRYLPVGAAASLLQALTLVPGYSQDGFEGGEWIGMLAVSLVLAAIVFMFAVPGGGTRTAVVLGVLSLLGAVAFWAAMSFPLAAGAIVVGLRHRSDTRHRRVATVAIALGVLAVVATLAITVGDAVANY